MNYKKRIFIFFAFAILVNGLILNLSSIFENKFTETIELTTESNINLENNDPKLKEITFAQGRHCGNNVCEARLGENVLNCPQDCFFQ